MAEFDPNQMPRTNRHAIRYPGGTDLVKYASQQFKAMAESIDDNIDDLPQSVTVEFQKALDATRNYRDEAEAFVNGTKRKPFILTFGDSYTVNTNIERTWPYQLGALSGSTVRNYGVSGAGWAIDDNSFIHQLQTAIADGSLDSTSVGIVIVAGGRNDIMDSDKASSAAVDFVSLARVSFPNARIIVVPMLWDNSPATDYERRKAAGISQGAVTAFAEVLCWAWTWNLGLTDCFPAGDIHPNAQGAKNIASYLIQGINGTYSGRQTSWSTVQDGLTLAVNASAGSTTYTWSGNIQNRTQDLTIVLPAWARMRSGQSSPAKWCLSMTNSGVATAYVNIADTWALAKTNNRDTPTGGTCGGSTTMPW